MNLGVVLLPPGLTLLLSTAEERVVGAGGRGRG